MTLYIVSYQDDAGRWVFAHLPTYIDALIRRAALRRMGIDAAITLREVDRVGNSSIATVGVG